MKEYKPNEIYRKYSYVWFAVALFWASLGLAQVMSSDGHLGTAFGSWTIAVLIGSLGIVNFNTSRNNRAREGTDVLSSQSSSDSTSNNSTTDEENNESENR